jgi:hypothetical protein
LGDDDEDKENKESTSNHFAIDNHADLELPMMDATTAAAVSSPSRKLASTLQSSNSLDCNTETEQTPLHFQGSEVVFPDKNSPTPTCMPETCVLETNLGQRHGQRHTAKNEEDGSDMLAMLMQGESRSLLLGF